MSPPLSASCLVLSTYGPFERPVSLSFKASLKALLLQEGAQEGEGAVLTNYEASAEDPKCFAGEKQEFTTDQDWASPAGTSKRQKDRNGRGKMEE